MTVFTVSGSIHPKVSLPAGVMDEMGLSANSPMTLVWSAVFEWTLSHETLVLSQLLSLGLFGLDTLFLCLVTYAFVVFLSHCLKQTNFQRYVRIYVVKKNKKLGIVPETEPRCELSVMWWADTVRRVTRKVCTAPSQTIT